MLAPAAQVHAATVHAAAAPQTIKGTVYGSLTQISPADKNGNNTLVVGHGSAQGLPGVTYTVAKQTSTLIGLSTISVTNGLADFAASGNPNSPIYATYHGSAPVSLHSGVQVVNLTGLIAGGYGSYAWSTGTFTGTVYINAQTQTFGLSFTLTVKPGV
jgi:hypothetical protein